jgi:hypothetical protein
MKTAIKHIAPWLAAAGIARAIALAPIANAAMTPVCHMAQIPHPAVILARFGQIQLTHDAAHVLFKGALGAPEPMSDTGIGTALCH